MTKQNADNSGQADSLMKDANAVIVEANGSMTEKTNTEFIKDKDFHEAGSTHSYGRKNDYA